MKRNKKIYIIVFIGFLLFLALIVFMIMKSGNGDENLSGNNQVEQTPSSEEPLNNETDITSKTRPYAVMINNLNEARAIQSGLSKAFIVYEMIVEGGITRYLALFKDVNVTSIGSVRSARHYYLDYVLENDAIFVHWGWSPQAQEDVKDLKINNVNGLTYEGTYFYRFNPIKIATEHTGFTKTELLDKAVNKLKYRKETNGDLLLNYSNESVDLTKFSVTSATDVTIKYSNYTINNYVYNKETQKYDRFVNGNEHKDYATNEQLSVKNIIVYKVKNYLMANDPKGRQVLENIGSGKGYYITEGKSVEITWEKASRESQTKYYFEDGTELNVNKGNTFIQIMPTTGELIIK